MRRSSEKHKNRFFILNRYQSHLSAIYSLRLRILGALWALRVLERVFRNFQRLDFVRSASQNRRSSTIGTTIVEKVRFF